MHFWKHHFKQCLQTSRPPQISKTSLLIMFSEGALLKTLLIMRFWQLQEVKKPLVEGLGASLVPGEGPEGPQRRPKLHFALFLLARWRIFWSWALPRFSCSLIWNSCLTYSARRGPKSQPKQRMRDNPKKPSCEDHLTESNTKEPRCVRQLRRSP